MSKRCSHCGIETAKLHQQWVNILKCFFLKKLSQIYWQNIPYSILPVKQIGCDNCPRWFHDSCLNMNEVEVNDAKKMANWKCPVCIWAGSFYLFSPGCPVFAENIWKVCKAIPCQQLQRCSNPLWIQQVLYMRLKKKNFWSWIWGFPLSTSQWKGVFFRFRLRFLALGSGQMGHFLSQILFAFFTRIRVFGALDWLTSMSGPNSWQKNLVFGKS